MTATRRWTATESGSCAVCGLESTRHSVVDAACPHTADSLTDDQVIKLWIALHAGTITRSGLTEVDCLDASPSVRASANAAGLYFPAPAPIEAQRAREKIAGILNTMEST